MVYPLSLTSTFPTRPAGEERGGGGGDSQYFWYFYIFEIFYIFYIFIFLRLQYFWYFNILDTFYIFNIFIFLRLQYFCDFNIFETSMFLWLQYLAVFDRNMLVSFFRLLWIIFPSQQWRYNVYWCIYHNSCSTKIIYKAKHKKLKQL